MANYLQPIKVTNEKWENFLDGRCCGKYGSIQGVNQREPKMTVKVYAKTVIPVLLMISLSIGIEGSLRAEQVSDPAGDAFDYPDVVSVSARFLEDKLFLSASFRDGSLNPANLGFIFGFDVDQDLSTGVQPPASFPLGADSSIYFNSIDRAHHAMVGGFSVSPAIVPVNFSSNSIGITLPLSSVGSVDGVMGFGFIVGVPHGTNGFHAFDTVPDSALGGSLSGRTSPIPVLRIRRDGSATVVRWDARVSGYLLESASEHSPDENWITATNEVTVGESEATITDASDEGMKFFRMRIQ